MDLGDIEIRRMKPSEAEAVARVDSYAYQNDPLTVALQQSNSEKARQTREKNLIQMYTNNPQETFVALHNGEIIGFIRSFPCTGLFKDLSYSEGEYEHIISSEIWELSMEQRRKWWLMAMKEHDLQTPHSHVGPFGVLPEYQGKGVGSMLIEDYFNRLEGVPSYLETFTSPNAHFYVKRGYDFVVSEYVLGMKGYWLLRE
jgi:GNAT superfamily N-acetyltransferase